MVDWREELDENKFEKVESFKIKSGSKTVTFLDEGKKWLNHTENKSYIIFSVDAGDSIARPFFVNASNFSFLKKIKTFGKLTGRKIVLTRTGERKATRWDASLFEEEISPPAGGWFK